jgi:hypothetical protein
MAQRIHDPIEVWAPTVVKLQEYPETKTHAENHGYEPIKTAFGHEESHTLFDSLNVDPIKHDHELPPAGEGAPEKHNRQHQPAVEDIDGNETSLAGRVTKQRDTTRQVKLDEDALSYYDLFMSNVYAPTVRNIKEALKQFHSQFSFFYLPVYIYLAQLVVCWVFDCASAVLRTCIRSATTSVKPGVEQETEFEHEQGKERGQEEAEKMSEPEHTTVEQVENMTATTSVELDMEPEAEPMSTQREGHSRAEEAPPITEAFEKPKISYQQETGHKQSDKCGTTVALFRHSEEQETFEEDEYETKGQSDPVTDETIKFQKRTPIWKSQKDVRKDDKKDGEDPSKLFEDYPFKDIFLQLFEEFEETTKKQKNIDEVLQQGYDLYNNLKNAVDVSEMARCRGGYHLLKLLVSDSQTQDDVMMQVHEECGEVQYEDLLAFCIGLLVKKTVGVDSRERKLHRELREMRRRVAILMVLVILLIVGEGAMMFYR